MKTVHWESYNNQHGIDIDSSGKCTFPSGIIPEVTNGSQNLVNDLSKSFQLTINKTLSSQVADTKSYVDQEIGKVKNEPNVNSDYIDKSSGLTKDLSANGFNIQGVNKLDAREIEVSNPNKILKVDDKISCQSISTYTSLDQRPLAANVGFVVDHIQKIDFVVLPYSKAFESDDDEFYYKNVASMFDHNGKAGHFLTGRENSAHRYRDSDGFRVSVTSFEFDGNDDTLTLGTFSLIPKKYGIHKTSSSNVDFEIVLERSRRYPAINQVNLVGVRITSNNLGSCCFWLNNGYSKPLIVNKS